MDRSAQPTHMDRAIPGAPLVQPHSTPEVVAVVDEEQQPGSRVMRQTRAWQLLSRPSSVHSVPKLSEQSMTGNVTKSRCICLLRDGFAPPTDLEPSTRKTASCLAFSAAWPIQTMLTSRATTTQPAKSDQAKREHFIERITSTSICAWSTTSSFRTGP